MVTILDAGGEFEQGLGAAATGGATSCKNVEVLESSGEQRAIFAGADESGNPGNFSAVTAVTVPVSHGDCETIMPKSKDERARLIPVEEAALIVPLQTPGVRNAVEEGIDQAGSDFSVPCGLMGKNDFTGPGRFRIRCFQSTSLERRCLT